MTNDPTHSYSYNNEPKEKILENLKKFGERFNQYIPYHTVVVFGVLPKTDTQVLPNLVKDGGIISTFDMRALNKKEILDLLDQHQARLNEIRAYVEENIKI